MLEILVTPEPYGKPDDFILQHQAGEEFARHSGTEAIEVFLEPVRELAVTAPAAQRRRERQPAPVSAAASGPAAGAEPSPSQPDSSPAPAVPPIHTRDGQTDLANARRFAASNRDRARYCHAWSKWLIWDGCRWGVDGSGAVMRLAKAIADAMWHEAANYRDDPSTIKWASRTASAAGISAMLQLAQSELPMSVEEMDANPWLLNCANGTVDLRTGTLRDHRREDSLTKLCPTAFDPAADAPAWERFLNDVFASDTELIGFARRLLGYAISGDVREQILPIFWGSGANGKSTLVDAISLAVGPDYCDALPRSLLLEAKSERHPTELASLFGKRLAIAHETDQAGRLSESLVKMLTGGDIVKARRMREDFWSFEPTHKIVLLTNHKPRVKGTDHAIWRRLRLVPFSIQFDGDRRDKSMAERLRAEAPGILAWLVRGCREWQRAGLNEPPAVLAATAGYRDSEDSLAAFFEECCLLGSHFQVKAGQLFEAYKQWAENAGERWMTQRSFGEALTERGIERVRSNGIWYCGIGLREENSSGSFQSEIFQ